MTLKCVKKCVSGRNNFWNLFAPFHFANSVSIHSSPYTYSLPLSQVSFSLIWLPFPKLTSRFSVSQKLWHLFQPSILLQLVWVHEYPSERMTIGRKMNLFHFKLHTQIWVVFDTSECVQDVEVAQMSLVQQQPRRTKHALKVFLTEHLQSALNSYFPAESSYDEIFLLYITQLFRIQSRDTSHLIPRYFWVPNYFAIIRLRANLFC